MIIQIKRRTRKNVNIITQNLPSPKKIVFKRKKFDFYDYFILIIFAHRVILRLIFFIVLTVACRILFLYFS
jgi:hypothetical protein